MICPCCGKHKRPANLDALGTALKPAMELIAVARKPLSEKTVAANVLQHGTGAINIDGCRIASEQTLSRNNGARSNDVYNSGEWQSGTFGTGDAKGGRWPANIIHDGSEEVLAAFPDTHSAGSQRDEPGGGDYDGTGSIGFAKDGKGIGVGLKGFRIGDAGGSAARFFYTAKADASDRAGSKHPTVKPVDLMQWLCRLVTPKRVLFCENCDTLNHEQNSTETASSNTPVRVVSDGFQAEGQSAYGQVLQSAVCGRGEGASTEAVRLVRDDVSAEEGRGETLLQPFMRGEVDGKESKNVEGLCHQQGGVSSFVDAGSSAIAQPEGLHLRASLGGATEDRQAADQGGSRASHQWDQKRQQAGKSGTYVEGGSRQDQPAETERPVLPSLSGEDCDLPTCKNCGHRLKWRAGRVLDPFAGTGTTGEAAFREGFNAVLIEREEEYQADIRRRMGLVLSGPDERSRESIKARTAGQPIDHGPLFGGLDTPPPTGQENLRGIRGRTIGPTGLKW